MRPTPRIAAAVAVAALVSTAAAESAVGATSPPPATATGTAAVRAAASDTTSAAEKARVDRVPTPTPDWFPCFDTAECATVRLPLDYDEPDGATTELAVTRVKAADPKKRIGTLFVNPGGPGGQGTMAALGLSEALDKEVRDRFDVVGFDPRGVGFSDNVQCFRSIKDQSLAMAGAQVGFPLGRAEEGRFIRSANALGTACSTTGRPLTGSASTAEAARDLDVLRRTVGDKKLTYIGFSYGTALGQYYANMFPDRVRALAVDGVVDPVSWVGTGKTAGQIVDDRLRSADGAYKALREILVRCGKAGKRACQFAQFGDPVKSLAVLAERLKQSPVTIGTQKITYADVVGGLLGSLYDPAGYVDVDAILTQVYEVTAPRTQVPAARATVAGRALAARIATRRAAAERAKRGGVALQGRTAFRRGFTYENGLDAFSTVPCTDGRHPARSQDWPSLTAAADKRAPYFGRAWGWNSAQCAGNAWTVRDEDAYTGPFNRRTAAPVLFVGNYHDPATNYAQAVSSNKQLPGSRLLSSDSWGHTAYGTSACVTTAVDAYLLRGTLPAAGKVCTGDIQPFQATPTSAQARRIRPQASAMTPAVIGPAGSAGGKPLPPVATRVPPSLLLGTR